MKKRTGGLPPNKYLSETQLKKLRKFVKEKADLALARGSERAIIDKLIVEIFVQSGIRSQELIDLNISDLPGSHGKDGLWIRSGKGDVERLVAIPESLQACLSRFVRLHRKGAVHNEPLFVNCRGQRISYTTVYSKIRRIGKQSGIGKLHPHVLRHTYLTRLYNVACDLRFCQDQAGHRSPTTTAIYAQTDNQSRKRQVDALD